MKAKVTGLVQKAQYLVKEITEENDSLEREREQLAEHYALQQGNLAQTYETAIKGLMDKRKQLSEILKHSLNEQKSGLLKQKNQVCQRIEQALTASERLTRFVENMDNLSYEEFHSFIEGLNGEVAELETFVNTLSRIELTYMQFYENIAIADKSEAFIAEKPVGGCGKKNFGTKGDGIIGLKNMKDSHVDGVNDSIEKIVFHESTGNNINIGDKKAGKKKQTENTGARTSRYAKQSPKMEENDGIRFFSPENNSTTGGRTEGMKKPGPRLGVTNPFVEESLLAKMTGHIERKRTPKENFKDGIVGEEEKPQSNGLTLHC